MPAREVRTSVAVVSDDSDSDSDSDRDSSSDSDSSSDTESSGDSGPSGDSDSSSDSSSDSGSPGDSSLGSPRSKQRVARSSSPEDDDGDDDCDSESDKMSDSGAEDNRRAERSTAARKESSQAGVEVDTDREDNGVNGDTLDQTELCMCTCEIPAEWERPRFPVMCSKLPPLPDLSYAWQKLLLFGNARADRRQARIGDALLEMLLPEILRERFNLPVAPRGVTVALVQNSVLSVLALHYGLYRTAGAGQHHYADHFEALVALYYDQPEQRAILVGWLTDVFRLAVFPDLALQIKRFRATLTSQRIVALRLKHSIKVWGLAKLRTGTHPLYYTPRQL